jgi:hypothetical protein
MTFGGILSQLFDFLLITVIYRKNTMKKKVAERSEQAGGVDG